MSAPGSRSVVVIGAGPAGLTAAYELSRRGIGVAVYEASDQVGGIARTVLHHGYRFDVGGHRFFTKIQVVRQLWEELLGDDLVEAERLSRIYYDGRFLRYPLAAVPTLKHLGLAESLRTLASYLRAKLPPRAPKDTLEGWIVRRFGRRLYETFFASYTEKVWGVPGSRISAEWAAQRIQGLSLSAVVANAVLGINGSRSLIQRFHYPVLGPGMLWERCAQRTRELGGAVELQRPVVRLDHGGGRVRQVRLRLGDREEDVAVDQVLSSMPIPELLGALEPPPPPDVRAAAGRLRHRSLVVVCLIIAREQVFPDHWIYVHDPGVRVGRIQNFKNWSRAMVPDPSTSSLGLEYFCDQGDDLWRQDDGALVSLAGRELERLGLAEASTVSDGLVIRQPHAYPTYHAGYAESLALIRTYLAELTNLQTIGRSGLHRYNNQDHSMLTALLAVRNLLGERHDLWRVNTEASSHEG